MQNTFEMEKIKLISFIIPTYNVEETLLQQCLASIQQLSLSKKEREIIVVDDGSPVPCPITATWWDDDIIYVRTPHQGLSAARNIGLDIAKGKYIQFVDSDDMLLQAAEEHCLDHLRFAEPDIVMFHLTSKLPDPNKAPSHEPATNVACVDGATYMRNNNLRGSVCGYIFRKTLLGSLRFKNNLLHEDELFTPQLILKAEKLYDLDVEAYYYRRRKNSITHTTDDPWTRQRLDDTEAIIAELNRMTDALPQAEREALQRRVAQLTTDYLYNTARLTRSWQQVHSRMKRLKNKNVYPLPEKKYTWKYQILRLIYENIASR